MGVSPGSNKAAEVEVTLKLLHGYRPLFPYCSRSLKGTWPLYFSLCLPSVLPTPFLILVHLVELRADPRAPDNFLVILRCSSTISVRELRGISQCISDAAPLDDVLLYARVFLQDNP